MRGKKQRDLRMLSIATRFESLIQLGQIPTVAKLQKEENGRAAQKAFAMGLEAVCHYA